MAGRGLHLSYHSTVRALIYTFPSLLGVTLPGSHTVRAARIGAMSRPCSDAGRNVAPAFGRVILAPCAAARAEGADRALGAAAPLP